MTKIKNENYIAIQGFMVKELGLTGNELIAYALIYGFSQDDESEFRGSLNYVANGLIVQKQQHLIFLISWQMMALLKRQRNLLME
mgnify:CR=1 FL=1